jgi:hypothetical protein
LLKARFPLAHFGLDALEEGRVGRLPVGAGALRHVGDATGEGFQRQVGAPAPGRHAADTDPGVGRQRGLAFADQRRPLAPVAQLWRAGTPRPWQAAQTSS